MTNNHTEPMKVGDECREAFEYKYGKRENPTVISVNEWDLCFAAFQTAWNHRTEPAPVEVSSEGLPDLGERIKHVGGRINDAGYVEFGSVMAIDALIAGVLRDAGGNCG